MPLRLYQGFISATLLDHLASFYGRGESIADVWVVIPATSRGCAELGNHRHTSDSPPVYLGQGWFAHALNDVNSFAGVLEFIRVRWHSVTCSLFYRL